ncbi:MAG: putative membrane protein [Flavobacteriales bacterium]|jgi:putative membrane protein
MKRLLYLCFFLLFAFFAFTVNLKNPQTVTLNYYFDVHREAPLVLVLTATFVVGVLLGWFFMTLSVIKNKRQVGKVQKALAKVETEVQNLRAMPLKDEAEVE